jgi:hypothetical protein
MARIYTGTIDELDALTTCALRIDGYLWAVNSGLERHELMRAFWHDDAWDELFLESWDYQWAAWFMQQRSLAWSHTPPSAELVRRWRQLFLALASRSPSPPFDRGGPDISGEWVQRWDERYRPVVSQLQESIRERLSLGIAIEVPIRV